MLGIPWSRINDFLLDCGKICHPRDFSIQVLKRLDSLIPYDGGQVYFFDETGTVIDQFLLNVDPEITKEYYEYCSKGKCSTAFSRCVQKKSWANDNVEVHNWSREKDDEMLIRQMRLYGIRYTFGMGLYDVNNSMKSMCILHRVSRTEFSDAEKSIISHIKPHLKNLFRIFFWDMSKSAKNTATPIPGLTARETEISALLGKGIAPALISQKLFISQTTVYKHIDNIHKKLGVSSRQEFLVKLYGIY
jgi:DNA-binding CsgD family transcriptional regulator